VVDVLRDGLVAGPRGVTDACLGIGVREQPVQPGAATALGLADPLGGLGLGLAERGVDQRVERGVGHGLLDQLLGLELERVDVGERQPERIAGDLHGGLGVAGVADRVDDLVVAQRAEPVVPAERGAE
jgi:hypothetical protein